MSPKKWTQEGGLLAQDSYGKNGDVENRIQLGTHDGVKPRGPNYTTGVISWQS